MKRKFNTPSAAFRTYEAGDDDGPTLQPSLDGRSAEAGSALQDRKRQHDLTFAARTVAWANETLALTFGEIGAVVDADERTVRRWRGSEAAPRTRHQASLEALVDLRHLLETVFETREAAAAWLETPLRGLGGHTPLSRLRRGRLQEIVEVLATVESGAFV